MVYIVIAIAVIVALIVSAAFCNSTGSVDTCDTAEDRGQNVIIIREKSSAPVDTQYFIRSHLHRDDEKHARHKRNQYPR